MADGGGLTVAGIRLDESGAHLFREVEAGFGTALVVELVDWDDPYFGGASEVLENGTPRIQCKQCASGPGGDTDPRTSALSTEAKRSLHPDCTVFAKHRANDELF